MGIGCEGNEMGRAAGRGRMRCEQLVWRSKRGAGSGQAALSSAGYAMLSRLRLSGVRIEAREGAGLSRDHWDSRVC